MVIIGELRAFAFGAHTQGFLDAIKQGWIPCDGRPLSITNHEDLYKAIEVTWGARDPGINFCVPNLFGSFLRGATLWTADSKDPDASLRASPRPDLPVQGDNGSNVGSYQECTNQNHSHKGSGKRSGGYASLNGLALTAVNGGPSDSQFGMSAEGGAEARPRNHYVMYMIYGGANLPTDTIDSIIADYSPKED